jgi:hypothetical protein
MEEANKMTIPNQGLSDIKVATPPTNGDKGYQLQLLHRLRQLHGRLTALMQIDEYDESPLRVQELKDELKQLESERSDIFLNESKEELESPSRIENEDAILDELNMCYRLLEDIQYKHSPLETELTNIKKELSRLMERLSLTLMDIIPYLNRLRALEKERIDGANLNMAGKIPSNQPELNKLFAECRELKDRVMRRIK